MIPLPSLAQLVAFARRIPGIAWVITLAIALGAAAVWAIFHAGVQHGEVKVQRKAVADSIVHVETQLQHVRAKADTAVHAAMKAKAASDAGRADARAVIAAHLSETPPEVVQAVNRAFALDSIGLEVHVVAQQDLLAERPVADTLHRLQVSQAAIGIPAPNPHWKTYVAGGFLAGVGVVVGILALAR